MLSISSEAAAPSAIQRIVFLGDSITDGHTYPLLVQQAIRESGSPVPTVINAGIGGDTAAGMSRRIERDVLVHLPTLVTLSAGINDALHKVPIAEYAASVTAIADRLQDEGVPLIILTTSIYGAKHAEAEKLLDEYNTWLEAFAAQRMLTIADVNAAFKHVRAQKGEEFFMEPDAVHPNWEGQRIIARAVLDALGFAKATVPQMLKLDVLPGVLSPWWIRGVPEKAALTNETARTLSTEILDDTGIVRNWTEYSLPEAAPQKHPWKEQERQRGFALSTDRVIGVGSRLQGIAFLENGRVEPKQVIFHVGADLQSIWLNGERIYQNTGWRGWHAGRERIVARLLPGRNLILIESGTQFFLSVTAGSD